MVPAGSAKVTVPPVPDDPGVPDVHPATRSATDAAIAVAHRLMIVQSLRIGRSEAGAVERQALVDRWPGSGYASICAGHSGGDGMPASSQLPRRRLSLRPARALRPGGLIGRAEASTTSHRPIR